MTGTLLGIKAIAWIYIISASYRLITTIITKRTFFDIIDFAIFMIIGINLLRRKDLARKFAIFFAYVAVIFTVIGSIIAPLMALRFHEKHDAKYKLYMEKQEILNKLTEQKAATKEIDAVKEEIANMQFYPQYYEELKNLLEQRAKEVAFNYPNILFLCYQLFIIYYLRKEYVRKQFETIDPLTEALKERYAPK